MAIRIDSVPALATQQRVERQTGSLSQNIPQGHIHATEGVIQDRTVSPIRTDEGGLPCVFDLGGILANQEGFQISVHGRFNNSRTLCKGGAAESIQSRFVRQYLDHDQANASRCRQNRLDVGYLE